MALFELINVSGGSLKNINFTLEKAEIAGLVFCEEERRPLLSEFICGKEKLSAGEILINGENLLNGENMAEHGLSFASFETRLFDRYSPLENLVFIGQLNGLSTRKSKEIASNLLFELMIFSDVDMPTKSLDAVNYRKLVVASAFMLNPTLVVFYDIFKNLDEEARACVQEFLQNHVKNDGLSVLLLGGDTQDVEFCDKLIFVKDGKVHKEGKKTELYEELGLGPVSSIKTLDGDEFCEKISDISQMPDIIKKYADKNLVSANVIFPTVSDALNAILEALDVD